ncbi:MAG: hypothetical protein K2M56_09740 [Muribaculaceae bacterium]|nr:hypothetical protein [Muribaculaceae bacterium]
MKVVVNSIIVLVGFVFFFFLLIFVSELYITIRKRLNTPKIGAQVLLEFLERDAYVCINGKVLEFSHFANENESLNIIAFPSESNKTIGGELAFRNNHGLGYIYIHPSAMANCDFIYGKYGLKWARNTAIADIAKDKIKKYRYE